MFGSSFIDESIVKEPMLLMPIGVAIGMCSFIFAIFSIKCPECKAKWFLLAVRKQDKNYWLGWLEKQTSCPECEKNYT